MSAKPRLIAGRYEVQPLGRGGMGTVWRGYDTVLDRFVAIKQIRAEPYHSVEHRKELADRFRREARVTAKIEHPGVPAIYDAAIERPIDWAGGGGSDGDAAAGLDQLYLVMQLVDGVTLSDLLAEHGPLPIPAAIAVTAQLCSVLSHAHAIPVVHRDLKPSNLMIDSAGYVKVLDFGVAAVLGTDVTRLTATGNLVGSRDYMSPEQFYGVGVSPRSDLYAVGCLLHEMLAGAKVFDGAPDPALRHVHDEPTPLRQLRPDVDEAVEKLVLDLLAKAPETRPASARVVFDRLTPFLPVPGARKTGGEGDPPADGQPDPTRPYWAPLTPRDTAPRTPGRFAAPPAATPAGSPPAAGARPEPEAGVLARLDLAEAQARAFVDGEHFTQAVAVLDDALTLAEPRLGASHRRVLDVHASRAAALYLGADYRRALPVFERLSLAYAELPDAADAALECRRQAAVCHVELGDMEAALDAYRILLDAALRRAGMAAPETLKMRYDIGTVYLAANRPREAESVLLALRGDLDSARDPKSRDLRRDVDDLLTRLRLTGGTGR